MHQRLRQQRVDEANLRQELLAKKAALEARLAARRSAGRMINRVMRGWWSRFKLHKALEEGKYKRASLKIKGTMRKGVLNRWREANEKQKLHLMASRLQRAWRCARKRWDGADLVCP